MAGIEIDNFDYRLTFQRDLKKSPTEVRRVIEQVLDDLLKYPQPKKLRFHSLNGFFDPKIFKIDVFPNKSWQITFEMDGRTALLRRLATHREIDRSP